jgi:hypothetical protein
MADYGLSRLDPAAFEQMVTTLAMRELGAGVTLFGPGADGGRDGYFEGEALYPSEAKRWSGRWYIQSKFHAPHLSKDSQEWLREQIVEEVTKFTANPERVWPDNWIVITNVDPSAKPRTGTFDVTKRTVRSARASLAARFHIWGGKKVLSLLMKHRDVAEFYGDFLTPGHVLTAIVEALKSDRASAEAILRHLIGKQLLNQQYAKLEQAGSAAEMPGLHRLFTDTPLRARDSGLEGDAAAALSRAAAGAHRPSAESFTQNERWWQWRRHPSRARTWFIRGGPGQGKSTLAQFVAQVQRAWFVVKGEVSNLNDAQKTLALEIEQTARALDIWPSVARIPITLELKDYAQWLSSREGKTRGILTYISDRLHRAVQQPVSVGSIRDLLKQRRWMVVFDGLDEVPHDVKNFVAGAVRDFLDDDVFASDADVFTICTSRPQGYSGQFDALDACMADLIPLSVEQALRCAEPLLRYQRSDEDADRHVETLQAASESPSVQELMTTPLQAHIMAIVVRGGARPPERRWKLFDNFYDVILKRETNREGIDHRLAEIFRRHDDLLKTVHNRLGFALHAAAEMSAGAQSAMLRPEFERVVQGAARDMLEQDVDVTVAALMEATTDRLVLVNTPDDGEHVRFDIRQLQEFFAAEFIREYDPHRPITLAAGFELLGADPHWREVTHFLLSALVEEKKGPELDALASVLQRFDTGSEEERPLWRRMARGALATARLLAEGVLEQDRRVRDQLRQTLAPAFAATDQTVIQALSSVNQPQSRAWLIGVLIDAMQESSASESVGAAAALVRLMPEDHPRLSEVIGIFRSEDAEFLALVARISLRDAGRCRWFLVILLQLLAIPASTELSTTGLRSIVSYIALQRATVSQLAAQGTLNPRETVLLEWLAAEDQRHRPPDEASADYFKTDWSTPEAPAALATSCELATTSLSVLRVADAVSQFALERTNANLQSMAKILLAVGEDVRQGLPGHVSAFIPLRPLEDSIEQLHDLASSSASDVESLMAQHIIHGRRIARPAIYHSSMAGALDAEGWAHLVIESPTIAAWLWSYARQPEQAERVLRGLIEQPRALFRHPNLWGEFAAAVPILEKNLRATLRKFAPTVSPIALLMGPSNKNIPLSLKLPDDLPLLPHLAVGLVTDDTFFSAFSSGEEEIKDARKWVRASVGVIGNLRRSYLDKAGDSRNRLGAIIFAWLHPNGRCLAEPIPPIAPLLATGEIRWFVLAAGSIITRLGSPHDPRTAQIAGELINSVRDNFRDRDRVDALFTRWRETSRGPATAAELIKSWIRT